MMLLISSVNTKYHAINVTNVYNVYKKIFVNAFIILSTFISVKITWAKRSKIMTGSQAIVHCVRSLIEFIGSR